MKTQRSFKNTWRGENWGTPTSKKRYGVKETQGENTWRGVELEPPKEK